MSSSTADGLRAGSGSGAKLTARCEQAARACGGRTRIIGVLGKVRADAKRRWKHRASTCGPGSWSMQAADLLVPCPPAHISAPSTTTQSSTDSQRLSPRSSSSTLSTGLESATSKISPVRHSAMQATLSSFYSLGYSAHSAYEFSSDMDTLRTRYALNQSQ